MNNIISLSEKEIVTVSGGGLLSFIAEHPYLALTVAATVGGTALGIAYGASLIGAYKAMGT